MTKPLAEMKWKLAFNGMVNCFNHALSTRLLRVVIDHWSWCVSNHDSGIHRCIFGCIYWRFVLFGSLERTDIRATDLKWKLKSSSSGKTMLGDRGPDLKPNFNIWRIHDPGLCCVYWVKSGHSSGIDWKPWIGTALHICSNMLLYMK